MLERRESPEGQAVSRATTFRWDDTSGFHHYSVDASQCFHLSKLTPVDIPGLEPACAPSASPPLATGQYCPPALTPANKDIGPDSHLTASPLDYDFPFIDQTLEESEIHLYSLPDAPMNSGFSGSAHGYPPPTPVKMPSQLALPPTPDKVDHHVVELATPGSSSASPCSSGHAAHSLDTEADSQYEFSASSEGSHQAQPQRDFMSTPRLALRVAPQLQTFITPIRPLKDSSFDEGHFEDDNLDVYLDTRDERTASLSNSQYDNITTDTQFS